MSQNDRVVRHVTMRGNVQGCGFRVWTERRALSLGVEGWVRNRRDGTVEAVFAGPLAAVDALIGDCRKGPPLSEITAVEVREGDGLLLGAKRSGEQFSLLPTV